MSSSKRSTIIVEHLRKQQMWDALSRGKRLDDRDFSEARELVIETDVIKKANGSARVKLGDTEVIAGVKVETGEPFEGLENKGALIISAEVLPTASPYIEPGPPDEETIELARVVDRGIRESEMLDLDKLVLVPGKIVYTVFVDCSVLNTDGNVVDTGKLQDPPLTTVPVSITAVRIGDTILLDPTAEEEACMNARITITTNSNSEYAAIQKGFAGGFTRDQIKKVAEVARIKGEEVRAKLQELTNKAG